MDFLEWRLRIHRDLLGTGEDEKRPEEIGETHPEQRNQGRNSGKKINNSICDGEMSYEHDPVGEGVEIPNKVLGVSFKSVYNYFRSWKIQNIVLLSGEKENF